jgi:uncharacterized protein (UPF0332 family)
MKQEIVDLVKYRLEKAKNTLSDAKIYIDKASLDSTVNRIYYAMFYAVNALLLTKGLSSSKHSGIRALLNREFVNKGLVEKEMGKFYSDMFDNRQEGDYKDFVKFEKDDVKEWLKMAEDFIGKTEGLILKIIDE